MKFLIIPVHYIADLLSTRADSPLHRNIINSFNLSLFLVTAQANPEDIWKDLEKKHSIFKINTHIYLHI